MKRIGIMGGTFNPVHKGHLALAKAAMDEFVLDEVVFIPTGTPPHKDLSEIIHKEHRYNMVKLAIKGMPRFTLSRIELDRKGFSYAVDTCNELKDRFGKDPSDGAQGEHFLFRYPRKTESGKIRKSPAAQSGRGLH
jgi:nicotinate-nucleotide adenylyltransferase